MLYLESIWARNKLKRILFLALVYFSFFFLQLGYCDGFVIGSSDVNKNKWGLIKETSQEAIIDYDGKIEKIALLINTKLKDLLKKSEGVWVLPIPSNPKKVDVKIADEFPFLYVKGVDSMFSQTVDSIVRNSIRFHLIWVNLPLFVMTQYSPLIRNTQSIGRSSLNIKTLTYKGVTVYNHLSKYGLDIELVSVADKNSFEKYVRNKGLVFPKKALTLLSYYIGKRYCFVLVWISNKDPLLKKDTIGQKGGTTNLNLYRPLGIYLSFPAKKIFYPLHLTSVYGSDTISILLYILSGAKLTDKLAVNSLFPGSVFEQMYLIGSVGGANDWKSILKSRVHNIITCIKIHTPAKELEQDLWISPGLPKDKILFFKLWFVKNAKFLFFVVYLLIWLSALFLVWYWLVAYHFLSLKQILIIWILGAISPILFLLLTLLLIKSSIADIDNKRVSLPYVLICTIFWDIALCLSFFFLDKVNSVNWLANSLPSFLYILFIWISFLSIKMISFSERNPKSKMIVAFFLFLLAGWSVLAFAKAVYFSSILAFLGNLLLMNFGAICFTFLMFLVFLKNGKALCFVCLVLTAFALGMLSFKLLFYMLV